jgi:HEAT repeat protein
VAEVAAEAANTLEYFPSLRVIRRLHELLAHADAKVREEAAESFQSIRCELMSRLCARDRRVAEHIRRWLLPVWGLLAFRDEELLPDENEGTFRSREEAVEAMTLADLLALLTDPDASPRLLDDRLWSNGWLAYGEEERRRLWPVLLTHTDPLVRERAARAFAAWQDRSGLLELVRDQHFPVRKSAMYSLGQLPPAPGVADLAWDNLHRHDTVGTHATETLDTFVRHAAPAEAVRRLGWIAGDHGWREGLRVAAVYTLAALGAAEEIRQLVGLLLEPPALTWALHVALLEAVVELRLPTPDLGHLSEVDNLHVQEVVAKVLS